MTNKEALQVILNRITILSEVSKDFKENCINEEEYDKILKHIIMEYEALGLACDALNERIILEDKGLRSLKGDITEKDIPVCGDKRGND